MNRIPTAEQRQIIESPELKFMVTASAGAGKTFVLVERYLWLIEKMGLEPHQILTITFTRKAAAEMKSRIVSRLREMGYADRAQVAETGPIQTIHSFCERLLRENSLAAGIDPDFEIMDESDRARLEDASIAKAMISIHTERPEAEALLRTLAGLRERGMASPYARLENAISKVLKGLRGTQVRLAELEALSTPEGVRMSFEQKLLAIQPSEVRFAFKNAVDGPFHERLKAAIKAAGLKSPAFLSPKFNEDATVQSARHTAGLVQLAMRAWSELEFEMVRQQRFDYALLERKAVQLLQESASTRRRISNQYRAVMVDEAQDVNPVQHLLLDSLGIERVMIVGDKKQSIYGFRQADVDQFQQRQQELPVLRLSKNFRSNEGILNFVDDLFQPMWSEDYESMGQEAEFDPDVIHLPNYLGVELWELADQDIGQTAQLLLEMQAESDQKLRDVTVLVRFSKFANDLHQRLEAMGVKSRIVGGTERFYVRLEIRDLANTLKSLADPSDDFALLATLRSPMAGVSLDTIAMLAKAKPVMENMEFFQAPNDRDQAILIKFLEWFRPLSQNADRLSAWEVLSAIMAKSDYLAAVARRRGGEKMLANVRKLLSLATKQPELGPIEFAEQIREIQRLAHKEGDAPIDDEDEETLTIMTIHKAKGLEFETVVLPDVHRRLGGRADNVEVDARLGLVATKFGKEDNLYLKWLAHERKEREMKEEMRVLYVALTRAKTRLCVVAHPKARNSNSIAAIIGKGMDLGRRTPPGVVRRGSPSPDLL